MKPSLKPVVCSLLASCWLLFGAAIAEPLPKSAVPDPLKSWIPWVLHGHEMLACPRAFNSGDADNDSERACLWPSRLELNVSGKGAVFRLEVQVFGAPALVSLPGEPGKWPQSLKSNGAPLAVTSRDDRPVALLPAGSHVVTGVLPWAEMPEDVQLPRDTGSLQLTMDGHAVNRAADEEGRLWLQSAKDQGQESDALTLRTARLVDDDIPLRVTTHLDLEVSGKPREVQVPMALLPGFVAESLNSQLPARLQDDGMLRLQVRPGNWVVDLVGHRMAPTSTLALPQGQSEEIWSFVAHNELRVVNAQGLTSVDPKQVPLPDVWRGYPAFQIKPGQSLQLVESRRGNPNPIADKLSLQRQIWLDFDGKGYTMQDAFTGTLSRTWRLEMAAPAVLGRVATEHDDQPVTRRAGATGDGVEMRLGTLTTMTADSRLEANSRVLPASGWAVDINSASADLNLPPGWQLLHASGVDKAEGSWLERWTLWDFFVVLLTTLVAAKLLGRKAAALLALALVASAHMHWAPRDAWLVLLGALALTRVLPNGKLQRTATWVSRLCVAVIALMLLPHAVEQIRLAIHPALEQPWQTNADSSGLMPGVPVYKLGTVKPMQAVVIQEDIVPPAPAPAPAPEPTETPRSVSVATPAVAPPPPFIPKPDAARRALAGKRSVAESKLYAPVGNAQGQQEGASLRDIDPNAKVQTGPGLPNWHWQTHHLRWQGPVQATQTLHLFLLPPWATAVLRLAGLALLVASFWLAVRALPARKNDNGEQQQSTIPNALTAASLAAVLAIMLGGLPTDSRAAETAEAAPGPGAPSSAILDELRAKITGAPSCLPQCADIARLRIEARGSQMQLRLEVHALADTMLPLPGQGTNWRPNVVSSDGKPAVVRRDESGALWLAVHAGVTPVLLMADVGNAANVEVTLPMPVREVTAQADGWTLNGLDARGLSAGALSLSRSAVGSGHSDDGTQRDGLPAFVRVQRTLRLGLHWTMDTQIQRLTPSRAPVRVKIRLLPGETVNNETVRVEDGVALVQLGAEESASFASSVKENPHLQWTSGQDSNQIERWSLEPSTQWHVQWSGIAPVQYVDSGSQRLLLGWQPWPGESVTLDTSKPTGSAGQTLTIDQQTISMTPGLHATDVAASARLRTSQGGNHHVQLPIDAEFLGLTVDGASLPVRPQGRELLIPITPGAHTLKIDWREPRGIDWWFGVTPLALGTTGVNATTEIQLGPDRVVLAVGGPAMGPTVLFWGVLLALLGAALALGRTSRTPLATGAWFLLGMGLAQTTLWGTAVVVAFFFALAARRLPYTANGAGMGRKTFNLLQIVLVLWALLCAAIVFDAIQTGLLGYPDMMVSGNGSSAAHLQWYQDRFAGQPEATWVLSMPVLAYRLLMLLWALWLAASIVKWVRWAWESFSLGGYWRKRETSGQMPTQVAAGTEEEKPEPASPH